MKKTIILLLLIILALLGYIFYKKLQFSKFENLIYSKSRYSLLNSSDPKVNERILFESLDFVEKLNSSIRSVETNPISLDSAQMLHSDYFNVSRSVVKDTSKAVLFTAPKILKAIMESFEVTSITDPKLDLPNAAFYVYFGKYSAKGRAPFQTTCFIQIANSADKTIFEDQLYDYGDLCPNSCPKNAQIK